VNNTETKKGSIMK